jgi:hypothetical protein
MCDEFVPHDVVRLLCKFNLEAQSCATSTGLSSLSHPYGTAPPLF